MKTIVLAALACLPLVAFSLQPRAAHSASPTTAASRPAATQPITADELVGKYKATCDSVHSFIIKTRCVMQANSKLTGKYRADSGLARRDSIEEMRYDGGKRLAFRYKLWGNPFLSPRKAIPEDKPQHTSFLYRDGRSISNLYAQDLPPSVRQGSVIISPIHSDEGWKSLLTGAGDSPLRGYLEADDVRLDEILTGATSLTLQPAQEPVGGSPCFVIDAATKYGKYSVWIDPSHGYNVARAQMVKNKGDIALGQPLPPGGHRISTTLQIVRFEKIKETWVPMEAEITVAIRRANGDIVDRTIHLTRMEVQLNPNWTATKAFDPDDIRDGAKVQFSEFSNSRCFWQGGKVLLDPREGDLAEADPELQKLIVDFNAQVASQPATAPSPH